LLAALILDFDAEVQAAEPASCFSLSCSSISLGIFLMKAAGTTACYDSISAKREKGFGTLERAT